MPRVALPDSCSHVRYLGVSTLHMFKINITSLNSIVDNLFMRHTFQDSTGYPRILDIANLRPLSGRHTYKGLLEVGPARLLAAMLGDLGVSTLRSIKTMTQFSSLS
jgi:hypothetical protein